MNVVEFNNLDIFTIDKFLTSEENRYVYEVLQGLNYTNTQSAREDAESTHLSYNVFDIPEISEMLIDKIKSNSDLQKFDIGPSYSNKYDANTYIYWHRDSMKMNDVTLLLYVGQETNDDYEDYGETQILIKNEIIGIRPTPGKMVIFPSRYRHRATTFKNKERYIIVFKCSNNTYD